MMISATEINNRKDIIVARGNRSRTAGKDTFGKMISLFRILYDCVHYRRKSLVTGGIAQGVKDAGGRFLKIVGKYEGYTSKYEEMDDRKVLGKFISQAFRDERTRARKKSGKSYSSKDENPPVMHQSTNRWNLRIWSDLAKRTFIALIDDGIDSIGAKQIFDKLMCEFLMFDFNRGFVQICDNEENNLKREKIGTTDTADEVDQDMKHKVRHEHEEPNTTVDTNTTDIKCSEGEKLDEVYRRTLLPVSDPHWLENTLNDRNAAKTLVRLFTDVRTPSNPVLDGNCQNNLSPSPTKNKKK